MDATTLHAYRCIIPSGMCKASSIRPGHGTGWRYLTGTSIDNVTAWVSTTFGQTSLPWYPGTGMPPFLPQRGQAVLVGTSAHALTCHVSQVLPCLGPVSQVLQRSP